MNDTPEILYFVAMSLDGSIATPDGGVAWLDEFGGDGEDHGFAEMWASIDGLLMGRGTYEFALGHPWMAPDRPSWVFTKRELRRAHPSVSFTQDEPRALLEELHRAGHQRLWLVGGGALAASFQSQDLISHYEVAVIPVLLGDGIPLFGRFEGLRKLQLESSRALPSGMVQLRYVARPPAPAERPPG